MPLCISRNIEGEKYAYYCHPEEEGYGQLLLNNLLRKQHALVSDATGVSNDEIAIDFPYDFKILSKPKPKLISIKGSQIKGYLFDFELTATADLMQLGYFAGFGEKNSSLGFGMVGFLK